MHVTRALIISFFLLTPSLAPAQAIKSSREMPVSELIDRLKDIGNDEYRLRTNIIAVGADAQGDLPEGLTKMQDPGPKAAEAMEELVRRGPAALEALCAHINDARPTRASIKGLGTIVYSAEYDWNWRSAKTRPAGTAADGLDFRTQVKIVGKAEPGSYTLAVGDLCFEIIGRIVNRSFRPARYQPSLIIIVNSPVLCPDLATAIRAEWAKLTPQQHRASLIQDVSQPDGWGRDVSGVQTLRQYYPDAIATAAVQRFKVPTYNNDEVEDFAEKSLFVDTDAASRRRKFDDFVIKNGPAAREGLLNYVWIYRDAPVQREWKIPPGEVLQQLAPNIDLNNPPQTTALDSRSTISFIECLQDIASPEIDAAVWELFTRTSQQQSSLKTSDDYIALACIARLKNKGHTAGFITWCQRRIANISDQAYHTTFRETLNALQ